MKRFLKEIIIAACIVLVVFIGLQVIMQQFVVNQTSMFPNLEEGERVFVNKVVYNFHFPHRGDIIVFRPPEDPESIPLIKRVIGLPGETVQIGSGKAYVNGKPLDEPYKSTPPQYFMAKVTVPADHYFVLGDNRNNSRDSHEGWTVPENDIIGKAWVSIWPPGKWGLVPKYAYANE